MGNSPEATATIFSRYQKSPTGRLRYVLAQDNLTRLHRLDSPLTVLDAAGGNGVNAEGLLERGNSVTLLEHDAEVLSQARERLDSRGLSGPGTFAQGAIESAGRFAPS